MSHQVLEIHQPGDIFYTGDGQGRILTWKVEDHGLVRLQPIGPPGWLTDPELEDRQVSSDLMRDHQ